jgi:hypothetical protein
MNTPLPEDFPWTESMLEAFFRQYLETALWSSTDESTEAGGEPLDRNYIVEDMPNDVRTRLRVECVDFITANAADLEHWTDEWGIREGAELAGHDFWLTRNGHGAGFWDRFSPGTPSYDAGKRLSEASEVYGRINLYVGDDGQVWASGYEG